MLGENGNGRAHADGGDTRPSRDVLREQDLMAQDKEPVVLGAEITDDGCIVIEFNKKLYPHTKKCIFAPESLYSLAEKADIPPKDEENEFPGIPLVEGEIRLAEEDDDDDGDEGKEKK